MQSPTEIGTPMDTFGHCGASNEVSPPQSNQFVLPPLFAEQGATATAAHVLSLAQRAAEHSSIES
eukprot:8345728-Karenia_brevis.AAC.1